MEWSADRRNHGRYKPVKEAALNQGTGWCVAAFAVDADSVDNWLAGLGAKLSLLLSGGRAVVLGASPEVNGCGIGFHTYRHGRFSLVRFTNLENFPVSEYAPWDLNPEPAD